MRSTSRPPVILLSAVSLLFAGCGMASPPRSPVYAGADHGPSREVAETISLTGSRTEIARASAHSTSAPAPVATGTPASTSVSAASDGDDAEDAVLLEEKLVIEGWVGLSVEDVGAAAALIRERIEAGGGRVVSENLSGSARSWSGSMQVKLPPVQARDFLAWMEALGEIRHKRIQGTDVSRTLFDQEIALDNLERTLARMRTLLDREGLDMQDILAIERELTRLRGEIERIKGEKRFLEHRVAFATVNIDLRRREGAILGASAKIYPGPRLSSLVMLAPGERERVSLGGGVAIHTPVPRLSFELDVFEGPGEADNAFLMTFGWAMYSDFLGRGKRTFLNPYLGARLGYGYLDGSAFVTSAGGGVELFKHKYVMLDAGASVVAFLREDVAAAVLVSCSLVFAF